MITLKKSHNSQWNKHQILDAFAHGCDIIEADVIWDGDFYLSHSWRPFESLYYGRLIDYLEYFKKYKGSRKLYFQIDLKFDNLDFCYRFTTLLLAHKNDRVMYVLSGGTEYLKTTIKKLYTCSADNIMLWDEFKKWVNGIAEVEVLKLYKRKSWLKRMNHF